MKQTHTISGSTNLEFLLDDRKSKEAGDIRGLLRCMQAIKEARECISKHYPDLEQIPQLQAPVFGPATFEYKGPQDVIEEIGLSLSGVMDVKTRRRLYEIHTFQTANEMKDRKTKRDYVPDSDMLVEPVPPTDPSASDQAAA